MKKSNCKRNKYFSHFGVFLIPFLIMASLFMLPGKVMAQEGWGPGQDKWKFALGGFFPAVSTELKVDGSLVGDNLDLESLGFSDDDTLWRLDGYWRFAQKHRFTFGYYQFNRDGNIRLAEQIQIGDEIFDVGFLTESELNMGFYTLEYLYSFYQGEKWELAGGLGVYWVDLEFSMRAALDINNQPIAGGPVVESTDFNGPLPFLALNFEYYFTPKWLGILKAGYFQLEVGDFDGKLGTFGANLEYQFTKRWGLGAGYTGFIIDAALEDSNLRGNIEYKYHGIQLYGTLRF